LTEAGYPKYAQSSWVGIFAPKGTPREIRFEVAAAVIEAMKRPQIRTTLLAAGLEPGGTLPEQFAEEVQALQKELGELVRQFPLE